MKNVVSKYIGKTFLAIVLAATAPALASAQSVIDLKLGHGLAVNTPTDLGAKRFAELVNERSGGKIKISVFPAAGLGNEQQLIEGLQLGAVDIAASVGAGFGTVLPEANVLGFLYLFRDKDHMQATMRGDVGKKFAAALFDKTTIRTIDASWYYGTRHLTANRPVATPDDLVGMKVRVLPVPIYEAGWRALGAGPTPVAFGELFTAIETNTVDAQENPLPIIKSVGIPLLHKNLTLTGHIVANMVIAMSDDAYSKLSPEQAELLKQAAAEAGEYQDKMIVDSETALISEFKDGGVAIINPDKKLFMDKVSTLAETFQNGSLAELYKEIQAVK